KDIKDRFNNDPSAYLADTLALAAGQYWKPDALNWTDCTSIISSSSSSSKENASDVQEKNPWSDTLKGLKTICPIEWARAMNALDCTVVWKDYSLTRDYSTDYFQHVTGPNSQFLIQKLLAMSGIRMAAVLNEIYDPHPPARSCRRCCGQRRRRRPFERSRC
ncbi:hypothetical protein BG004_007044, partial [Podila humilis]